MRHTITLIPGDGIGPEVSRAVQEILAAACFFFSSRRRHTRSKRDWSSDVCSSDLHSDRRGDRDYGPWQNAEAVASLMESVAPTARCVIGMSLGGATTIRLAAQRPDLCRRAVFIDVTPQINDPSRQLTTAERGTVSLIAGPPVYDSFDEMADAAVALSPFRSAAGVRRGVRHNARRLDDGRWTWRYDLFGPAPGEPVGEGTTRWVDFTELWDDVSAITVPALFVRGGLSPFVRDEDIAEMQRRLPSL